MSTSQPPANNAPLDIPPNNESIGTPLSDPVGASSRTSLLDGIMSGNPYFTAGFGLMGLGVALGGLRKGGLLLATAAQRRLLVSLEIPSRDRAYPWFLEWMAAQSKKTQAQRKAQQIRLFSNELSVETNYREHRNGSADIMFSLVPGVGNHFFKYRGAWMQVRREREKGMPDLSGRGPFETVKITTLSRDRHLFPILLEEARQMVTSADSGRLVIHDSWNTEWRRMGLPQRKRALDSVVLAGGVKERIVEDIKTFLNSRSWYEDRGLPYRRGYLLHGPPGSGKSSFIKALAGALSYDICLLNLSQRGMMDDKLNHLMLNVPERSIVLIEDVDAAFNKRVQSTADGYQSGVTFSGLLNVLDGVASAEERILFMTTNHVSVLDPALIRPGRVDITELIDDAIPSQAKTLFLRFYGESQNGNPARSGHIHHLAGRLENIVASMSSESRRVSMAALQGHFIRHSPDDAIETCNELFIPHLRNEKLPI